MKFCGSCGAALHAADVFCGSCGAGLQAGPQPAPPAPPAPPPAAPTPLPPPPAVPAVPAPAPAPVTASEPATVTYVPTEAVVPVITPGPAPMVDPPGSRRSGTMFVFAILAVAAIVAGVVVLVTRGDDDTAGPADGATAVTDASADGSTPATGPDGTGGPGGMSSGTTIATTTLPPTTTDPVAAALVELSTLVENDRPTADGLQNSFVVQLSAKKIGLVVDGVTYGPIEILADHMARRDTYGAILVDAGRYQFSNQGQPMTGWFLTIVPQTFPTRDAANQWCTDHGLGTNDCFGRTFQPLA